MNASANDGSATASAIFAAGCFWGVEADFRKLPGVLDVVVGYTGGAMPNPTYRDVCSNQTGHAEAVRVTYDPARVSYRQLVDYFWSIHDPTTPNRQGPDVGSQYRSAIFTQGEEQTREAEASKRDAQARFARPIVTEIVPAGEFYRGEEYHQRYLDKQGVAGH
ncbi:MAG: peptide-methionine (S)-S-oxide reductase MsrA [Candidatus Eremiobacteraeota bacterium]|nr:peptide-methionine (S)-S-oxide reductase MsrA [Candidatus Eremiobacteraeota bacterium]MBV9646010.1 peptide-methionine (S)-S-oxide reductase MsrA [Candidatus Eremiobacteraeota bacterium]